MRVKSQGSILTHDAQSLPPDEYACPATLVYIDLKSKYAEVLAFSSDEVLLTAADRTLHTSGDAPFDPTIIKIETPGKIVDARVSRYTLIVTLVPH